MKTQEVKPLMACPECEGTRVKNQDFVNLEACPVCAARVAAEFSCVLRRWLPSISVAEAARRNKTSEYEGCCASHDFCDANMAMHEAMINLGITPCIDQENDTVEYDAHLALWNAASDIAKAAGFSPSLCAPTMAVRQ